MTVFGRSTVQGTSVNRFTRRPKIELRSSRRFRRDLKDTIRKKHMETLSLLLSSHKNQRKKKGSSLKFSCSPKSIPKLFVKPFLLLSTHLFWIVKKVNIIIEFPHKRVLLLSRISYDTLGWRQETTM